LSLALISVICASRSSISSTLAVIRHRGSDRPPEFPGELITGGEEVPPRAATTRPRPHHQILFAEDPDHVARPVDNRERQGLLIKEYAACAIHRHRW